MAHRFAGAIFALCIGTAAACAQELRVRAGEHAGFSRLVLYLGDDSDWQVNRIAEGYRAHFGRAGSAGFDLAEVFTMIPRDRVRALEPAEHDGRIALDILLGCACHATGFLHAPGILVIDIRDGPPPADAPFEAPADLAEGPAVPPATENPSDARVRAQPAQPATAQDVEITAPSQPSGSVPRADLPALPMPERPAPLLPGAFAAARAEAGLDTLRDAAVPDLGPATAFLESEFARARALGLITPASLALPPARAALEHRGDVDMARNMRSRTANDPDRPAGASGVADRSHCIGPDRIDLPGWATGPTLGDDLGAIRARLFGEFDRLDREAAGALVRMHLHYGFGAEAARLLELFSSAGTDLHDTPLLLALARVVDMPATEPVRMLAGQTDCPGPVSLWHLLAHPLDTPPALDTGGADEVVLTFASLPAHLRRHLGATVTEALLRAGARDAARSVLDAMSRAITVPDAANTLVRAQLELATGRADLAEILLDDVVSAGRARFPKALPLLVELRAARDAPVETALIDTIALAAAENRATALGHELRSAEIRALVLADRLEDALTTLRYLSREGAREPVPQEPFAAIADRLATEPDPARLLRLYFAERDLLTNGSLPAVAARRLAQRLQELGLADEAFELFAVSGSVSSDADRLALASITTDLGRDSTALALLAGLDTPEARALRARIHAARGDHVLALAATGPETPPDLRETLAWRAGAWERLVEDAPPPRRAAAAFMQDLRDGLPAGDGANDESDTAPADTAPLAPPALGDEPGAEEIRSLLAHSRSARGVLGDLLAGAPPPSPPPPPQDR